MTFVKSIHKNIIFLSFTGDRYITVVVAVSYESKLFRISIMFGHYTKMTHPMYISRSNVSQVKHGPHSAKLNKPSHMTGEISCDYSSVV